MHVPRLDFGLSQQLCLHSWWVSQNLISCKKSAYSAEIIPCVDWQEWMSGGGKLVRVSTLPRSFTFHSIFSHFCVSQTELKITKDRQWWSYIIVLRAARRVKKRHSDQNKSKNTDFTTLYGPSCNTFWSSANKELSFSASVTHTYTHFSLRKSLTLLIQQIWDAVEVWGVLILFWSEHFLPVVGNTIPLKIEVS